MQQESMSQRDSGYERKERDLYETPEWVTEALSAHLPDRALMRVWEPAAGAGRMVGVFERWGAGWFASDIEPLNAGVKRGDFFRWSSPPHRSTSIITNPPYDLATEFCEHALRLMEPVNGLVAMLLRTDFDHAKSRTHLFRDCPAFSKKLVLMKRIAWFVEADGKPKASPSFNHAWYIWNWKHSGPPTIGYGP
jgi:hypothetical protein